MARWGSKMGKRDSFSVFLWTLLMLSFNGSLCFAVGSPFELSVTKEYEKGRLEWSELKRKQREKNALKLVRVQKTSSLKNLADTDVPRFKLSPPNIYPRIAQLQVKCEENLEKGNTNTFGAIWALVNKASLVGFTSPKYQKGKGDTH